MSASLEDLNLDPFQQEVLDELVRVLTARERFSSHRIAHNLGCSAPTVRVALRQLRDKGVIFYQTYPRRRSKVRLLINYP